MPSISTRKLNPRNGSVRVSVAIALLLDHRHVLTARVGGPQADTDDDELGGLDWCDADEADQSAVINIGLGHGGAVTLDEECLLLRRAFECAVAPHSGQEVRDRT